MLGDMQFLAMDTSGLEPQAEGGGRHTGGARAPARETPSSPEASSQRALWRTTSIDGCSSIQMRATRLTQGLLHRADVILFLLDGKDGVTPMDTYLASWFRASGSEVVQKIIPVMNKCEGRGRHGGESLGGEVSRLGFNDGEYVGVSAETGEGMADLYVGLQARLDAVLEAREASVASLGDEVSEGPAGDSKQHPKVAIMGLTNVGKSTLLNALVGHDRCITGPEPGLTRDAITVELKSKDGEDVLMEVVDTAGWIKKTRLKAHDDSDGAVAEMTMREGKTVLRFVHVVLLIVDCERVLESLSLGNRDVLTHAEASLAADAVSQGRALVIGVNKVDVCGGKNDEATQVHSPSELLQLHLAIDAIQESVRGVTPELGDMTKSIIPLSAKDGTGVGSILPTVQRVYATWNRRVPTSKLNSWLKDLIQEKAHVGGGNSVSRIKYLSQVKSRPPTFVAFVSGKNKLGDAVERFVCNRLRDDFELHGVPVRLITRVTQKNK